MSHSIANGPVNGHPVLPDIGRPQMAKATVQDPDIAWNEQIGRAIARSIAVAGWSSKEAAAKVGVDDAEFGKWLSGTRRPHFDRLFAVSELQRPLVMALGGMVGAEITEELKFRQVAAS